jgi:hypothetical protein
MSSMSRDIGTSLCFDEDVTASKLGIGRRMDGKAEKSTSRPVEEDGDRVPNKIKVREA